MALWIKANGTREEVQPANGEEFTLEEMNNFVGGYLEAIKISESLIKPSKSLVMYINEEGMRLNLPYNEVATLMLRTARPDHRFSFLLGDVLIASLEETGDDQEEE